MNTTKRHIKLVLLLAAGLLAGCVRENPPTPETQEEIRLDASVWQMMQGAPSRRVSTYDNPTALQTEGSFTAAAYEANSTTAYINLVAVNWDVDSEKWLFSDGKHYWPASGALDFFAYMPATPPSYIADLTYSATETPSVTHNVSFACTDLPMTNAGQSSSLKEFVYAMTLDQDKAGTNTSAQPTAGKVALTFQHPFAKVVLQLSASQPKDVTISTITFKSIQNNGTYTHNGGWTPSGVTGDFVVTLNQDFIVTGAAQALGAPAYLMVPQAWTGTIELGATWKEWGEEKTETLTASVPTTWAPGYSYTYSFTISEYDLIVDIQKYTEQW